MRETSFYCPSQCVVFLRRCFCRQASGSIRTIRTMTMPRDRRSPRGLKKFRRRRLGISLCCAVAHLSSLSLTFGYRYTAHVETRTHYGDLSAGVVTSRGAETIAVFKYVGDLSDASDCRSASWPVFTYRLQVASLGLRHTSSFTVVAQSFVKCHARRVVELVSCVRALRQLRPRSYPLSARAPSAPVL